MNDRKNLPKAIKLNDHIERIEAEAELFNRIFTKGIDTIVLYTNNTRTTIYLSEINELGLNLEFDKFLNQIKEAREKLIQKLEEKIKEL